MHIYGVELMGCAPVSGHWVDMVAAGVLVLLGVIFGLVMGMNIMIQNPKRPNTGLTGPK